MQALETSWVNKRGIRDLALSPHIVYILILQHTVSRVFALDLLFLELYSPFTQTVKLRHIHFQVPPLITTHTWHQSFEVFFSQTYSLHFVFIIFPDLVSQLVHFFTLFRQTTHYGTLHIKQPSIFLFHYETLFTLFNAVTYQEVVHFLLEFQIL